MQFLVSGYLELKAKSLIEGARFPVDVERGTGGTSPLDLSSLGTQFFIIKIL